MVAPLGVGLFLTQAFIFGLELGDLALQFADALLAALTPSCLSFRVGLHHASYVTGALRQDQGKVTTLIAGFRRASALYHHSFQAGRPSQLSGIPGFSFQFGRTSMPRPRAPHLLHLTRR
jgi:hypothetical protein